MKNEVFSQADLHTIYKHVYIEGDTTISPMNRMCLDVLLTGTLSNPKLFIQLMESFRIHSVIGYLLLYLQKVITLDRDIRDNIYNTLLKFYNDQVPYRDTSGNINHEKILRDGLDINKNNLIKVDVKSVQLVKTCFIMFLSKQEHLTRDRFQDICTAIYHEEIINMQWIIFEFGAGAMRYKHEFAPRALTGNRTVAPNVTHLHTINGVYFIDPLYDSLINIIQNNEFKTLFP